MADFETAVQLGIEVDQSQLQSARDEIESSIGSVTVSGGGATGGGALADGGRNLRGVEDDTDELVTLAQDRNRLLADIIDALQGGGGGDGGRGPAGGLGDLFGAAGAGILGGVIGAGGLGGAAGVVGGLGSALSGAVGTVGSFLGGIGSRISGALGSLVSSGGSLLDDLIPKGIGGSSIGFPALGPLIADRLLPEDTLSDMINPEGIQTALVNGLQQSLQSQTTGLLQQFVNVGPSDRQRAANARDRRFRRDPAAQTTPFNFRIDVGGIDLDPTGLDQFRRDLERELVPQVVDEAVAEVERRFSVGGR